MSASSGESAGFVCVDEREFAATGLVLGDGRDVASWNGAKFTLVFGRT